MRRTTLISLSIFFTFSMLAMGSYAVCIGGTPCTVGTAYNMGLEAAVPTVDFQINKFQYPSTIGDEVANGTLSLADCQDAWNPVPVGSPIPSQKIGKQCNYIENVTLDSGSYVITVGLGTKMEQRQRLDVDDQTVVQKNLLKFAEVKRVLAKTMDNVDAASFEVKKTGDEVKYEIRGGYGGRLLGFIPVTIPTKATVNAQSGAIENTEKVWWAFLASK